jgi:hypothetical protein
MTTDEPESEGSRRLAAVLTRFPDRFDSAQVEEIRRRIDRSVALAGRLSKVDLPNGVGPEFDPRSMPNE